MLSLRHLRPPFKSRGNSDGRSAGAAASVLAARERRRPRLWEKGAQWQQRQQQQQQQEAKQNKHWLQSWRNNLKPGAIFIHHPASLAPKSPPGASLRLSQADFPLATETSDTVLGISHNNKADGREDNNCYSLLKEASNLVAHLLPLTGQLGSKLALTFAASTWPQRRLAELKQQATGD